MQTLFEVKEALTRGEMTSAQLVDEALAAVDLKNGEINSVIEVLPDEARASAEQWDADRIKADETLLGGVPIVVKDVICTTEGHTTAASHMLKGFKSTFGATAVERLKEHGAIVIGKANCDEFAMGSSNEYSVYGPVKNPWDHSRVAGGSSGGSAAAVAAGMVAGSLGTETGGSIRNPASFCNVVGLKATYGRVSRFGAIAYGSSLDQIGPMARTVQDVALLLSAMAGQDVRDATSSAEPVADYVAVCGADIAGLRIGVPAEFFGEGLDAEVEKLIRGALQQLQELGAELVDVALPLTQAAVPVYYLIAKAEASTNLGRYDGIRYAGPDTEAAALLEHYIDVRGKGFGPEVKRAILMGTYALSSGYYDAWYKQASRVRTLIRRQYEEVFRSVDVLAGPVMPEPAFPIGAKADDPLAMYLTDALTVPANVAGVPALSVPAGFTEAGLPVGLQLVAPHFEEARLFQVGHAYEQACDWWKKIPRFRTNVN